MSHPTEATANAGGIVRRTSGHTDARPALYPIADLTREHQGKVTLINICEFVRCKGQMGRPWMADEGPDTHGTDSPDDLRWCGYTHFMLLTEIEEAERATMVRPLTQAEERLMDYKYGRSAVTVTTVLTGD